MATWRVGCRRLILVLPVFLWGCSVAGLPFGSRAGPPKRVITAEEIERSGATNAWEVLEQNGTSLELAEERRIPERARKSLELTDLPRVIVDGIQMLEVRLLRDIPANLISSIRILSGLGGDPVYSASSASDIIVIETRSDPKK